VHSEAREWCELFAAPGAATVLEVGSLYVNGGVRDLFPGSSYIGINDSPGHGVDVVCDAAVWEPEHEFDVVISTEVLEHAERWRDIVAMCGRALRRGGSLILTCAGPGRGPHGQHGAAYPADGEWYENVSVAELSAELTKWGAGVVRQSGTDVQAFVVKL
jgi:SAM-dependent methyltransferase